MVTRIATNPNDKPQVLGKTEVIKNTLSPKWVQSFTLDYELGTPVKIAVSVFDENTKRSNKPMGTAVFEIGELLGARGNTKAKKLKGGGTLFALARKSAGSGVFRLQLKGSKLKNVEGLLGKSDPFFEVSRRVDAAGSLTWDNVVRSKVIKNNLNPEWDAIVVELSQLCGGDHDLPLQVAVFDFESSGKHVPMGHFETSVRGLLDASKGGREIKLLKKGKEVGSVVVVRAEVSGVQDVTQQLAATSLSATPAAVATSKAPVATSSSVAALPANFIDYVSGGCELNVVVAIDFTGSNGDPRVPGTLHHLQAGGGRNDYERAISAIVSILAQYDSDQKFPVLGFGAKYGGSVRHCFQCGPSEEVHGVDGVLQAYRQVFSSGLVMSGPTVFTEVIETAAARAQSSLEAAQRRGSQSYTVLLILTDGAVSDVNATAASLRRASASPLSVVIVGVGNADFSAMQFLDDSAGPGQRDVAQFVQFNRHSHNSVALTSETLHEVPDQLSTYFQSRGISPLPPLQRSDSDIAVGASEDEEIDLSLDIRDDGDIVVASGGDGFVDGFGASR